MIDGLIFDRDNFIGRRATDGLQLPSVTSCIKKAGFIPDLSYINEHFLLRGKATHEAIRLYEANDLDLSEPLHFEVQPRLEAWIKFKKETECLTAYSEQEVWSPALCYWGILDWAGILNGKFTVIDFKSGPVADWVRYQTAGYSMAISDVIIPGAEVGIGRKVIARRFGLELKEDGNYLLSPEFKEPNDFRVFEGMVAHMWEKLNRGYLKHKEAHDGYGIDGDGQGANRKLESGWFGDNPEGKGVGFGDQGFRQP